MSWHKTHRTTSIYQAVLVSLVGMVSLNASAMNLGQANIKSAQHEPLSATINVTNIDAANFHASIASTDIYRQMGLSPDAQISVNFTPTSNNAGQIVLTSSKPISTPFADVVLNLNNNGEQIIEPQTLLMPLPAGTAFTLPDDKSTQVLTAPTKPNLPEVSPLPDSHHAPDVSDAKESDEQINVQIINQNVPVLEPVPTAVGSANAEGNIISKEEKVLAQLTPEGANKQINVLTEEIVRRTYSAGQPIEPSLPPLHEEPVIAQNATPTTPSTSSETPTGEAVYVVQHGDSLWSIANAIAKANDMKVGEVMTAIHQANPDAFNKGNINQLKTNASLNLPNYQVVLSQKAIAEAIHAKQENAKSNNKTTTAKATTKQSTNKQVAKTNTPKRSSQVTAKPAQKALPKAQMTLVTPTQQGKATGTSNKSTPNAVTGGNNNLAGTLQNTRQQTAGHAKRVNELNQELSSAAKKVQLQNQKLAELENRLKSLREQK
ncbi:MAG: FimV/HubP family polar landmark protein [Moraxella sp.]|uniref:type IV pilus assembly protein FimV n=1 Tax=Moraxella sp. TaxID=479 RepID=UPI0026DB6E46|nr:FimV/HubP family polar landmark protein [Moraxella sp.]MDO4449380.1 FimV/HubP family polar landmark protein [Moraxella sp.]